MSESSSSGSSLRKGKPIGDGSGPENRGALTGLGGSTPSPSAIALTVLMLALGVVNLGVGVVYLEPVNALVGLAILAIVLRDYLGWR